MFELVPLALTGLVCLAYGLGLRSLQRRGDRWAVGRVACLAFGSLCVAGALVPPMATYDERFPVHVGQHLLLGMTSPALLALSAPVTLALRTLPTTQRAILLKVVHSRLVAFITTPATAIVVQVGGLYVLYLTGLYADAENNDLLHAAVHFHMFAAGCLLSWTIIGIDPIRRRPSFKTRLAALIVAGAAHDTLTKLMYAHDLPHAAGSLAQRHTGAMLMYYGGTVIDLGIAVVLMTQWWRVTGRDLARTSRRAFATEARGCPRM